MKTISKIRCIIVGIFDNAWDMDRAVERLAAAGFDDTVYDEAIVKEEPGSVDPAIPTLAPRSAPEVVLGSDEPNLLPKRDKQTIVRAFKSQLADYHYDLSPLLAESVPPCSKPWLLGGWGVEAASLWLFEDQRDEKATRL